MLSASKIYKSGLAYQNLSSYHVAEIRETEVIPPLSSEHCDVLKEKNLKLLFLQDFTFKRLENHNF